MLDLTMDNDNSRSSSEDSMEDISTNETVQRMDLDEKLCSNFDENSRIGLVDAQREASASSRMADQLKSFGRHPLDGAANNISAENLQHPYGVSPFSSEKSKRNDEKIEKFEVNLEKFLKERGPLREVQLRKKTETSTRQVKSDGEMAKIIEYCGDMLKNSLTLPNTNRSSAPPTFNNQLEPKQISQTDKVFCVESCEKMIISKEIAQNLDNLKKDAIGTENSPTRMLDQRLIKISAFKVPISPDQKVTPGKSAKKVSTGSKEDAVTPVQSRPTNFDVKPRKAFYMFSPGCSSGVIRQCHSLPNINRPRRKYELQRRSLNFGEHSRIVRSLFSDNQEQTTPESKMSTVNKSSKLMEAHESTENTLKVEAPMELKNRSSKICRKLLFGSSTKELTDKSQIPVVDKASSNADVQKCSSLEDTKHMEVPNISQNRPSKTCKKLFFGASSKETTDKSQQPGVSCDAESPSKRKNVSSVDVECSIATKKVRTSLETKMEEIGSGENVTVVDACSISPKKARTSTEIKMEGSGENERKSESPVDVESSISSKKVKTSKVKEMEESGSV